MCLCVYCFTSSLKNFLRKHLVLAPFCRWTGGLEGRLWGESTAPGVLYSSGAWRGPGQVLGLHVGGYEDTATQHPKGYENSTSTVETEGLLLIVGHSFIITGRKEAFLKRFCILCGDYVLVKTFVNNDTCHFWAALIDVAGLCHFSSLLAGRPACPGRGTPSAWVAEWRGHGGQPSHADKEPNRKPEVNLSPRWLAFKMMAYSLLLLYYSCGTVVFFLHWRNQRLSLPVRCLHRYLSLTMLTLYLNFFFKHLWSMFCVKVQTSGVLK